jgi:hypothetical protein
MPYKITIEKKQTVTQIVRGPHTQIGTKEVEREERYYSHDADEPRTRIEPVYGYAPDREAEVVIETKVLEQTVDELDLPAVIKAINKL